MTEEIATTEEQVTEDVDVASEVDLIDTDEEQEESAVEGDDEVEENQEVEEKPAHIRDYEERITAMEIEVGKAAGVAAKAKAEYKREQKYFDQLTERLNEFVDTPPEPTLFDGKSQRKCRKCKCTPEECSFATDDLCRGCADALGKDEGESESQDETQQEKQARETLETCPVCLGKGCDDEGVECINCEGTGKVDVEAGAEAEEDEAMVKIRTSNE